MLAANHEQTDVGFLADQDGVLNHPRYVLRSVGPTGNDPQLPRIQGSTEISRAVIGHVENTCTNTMHMQQAVVLTSVEPRLEAVQLCIRHEISPLLEDAMMTISVYPQEREGPNIHVGILDVASLIV